MSSRTNLWDLVDPSLVTVAAPTVEPTGLTEPSVAPTRLSRFTSRARMAALNALGWALWSYIFVKVFLFDVDSYAVRHWAPQLHWVVDNRYLIFVGVALIVVALSGKFAPLTLGYLAFFPIVVLVWKIPRLIYGRRSWNLAIGALHVMTAWILGIRFTLAMVFSLVASAVLVATHVRALLTCALVLALGSLLVGSFRMLTKSVAPSRFIAAQQRMVSRTIGSDLMGNNFKVDDLTPGGDVQKMSKAQVDTFLSRVSTAAIAHRAIYFWAYRMEEYRRSPAALLSSGVSVGWLLGLAVYCFAVANYAVYKLDPKQYDYSNPPHVLNFLYYSVSALFVNEVTGLTPHGNIAVALKIGAALFGAVFVLSLVITFVVSYRQSKDDAAAKQVVEEIRERAVDLDRRMRSSFDVSAQEAVQRLHQMQHGLNGILAYLGRQLPPEFDLPPDTGS